MALYDNTLPVSQSRARQRSLSLGGWDRTMLGLTGYREDGGSNLWGDMKGYILPAAGGIIGGIWGGPMGAKAGSALGQMASQGLSSLAGNTFEGTDTRDSYLRSTQENSFADSIGGTVGSLAGNLASGMSEKTDSIGNIFKRRMRQQPTQANNASFANISQIIDSMGQLSAQPSLPDLNESIRTRDYLNRRLNTRLYDNQIPIQGVNTSVSDLDRALGYNIGGILS